MGGGALNKFYWFHHWKLLPKPSSNCVLSPQQIKNRQSGDFLVELRIAGRKNKNVKNMKKNILVLILIFVCFGIGFYFWQTSQIKPEKKPTPYQNSIYGFSLEIPARWKDKYAISEKETETEFLYLKDVYQPIEKQESIFKILVFTPQNWQEIQSEPGYHGTKIYKDENMVFVYVLPLENPYSTDSNYRKEAEEFQRMVGDVKEIIESFKYSSSVVQLSNPASVYCQEQGGVLEIRETINGQRGFCIFDDSTECEEWKFFNSECKKGDNFCKDLCGDGICQEGVCAAVGCPCSETSKSCPEDCVI